MEGGGIVSVSYEIPWRRKSYLAKLDGPSGDRFGLIREFESGTPVKGRGVLKYDLGPGWYEWSHYGADKTYVKVDEIRANEITGEAVHASMDVISAGPDPETNGAWGYDRCACGSEVDSFDGVGFPYCAEHVPGAELAPVLEVPL